MTELVNNRSRGPQDLKTDRGPGSKRLLPWGPTDTLVGCHFAQRPPSSNTVPLQDREWSSPSVVSPRESESQEQTFYPSQGIKCPTLLDWVLSYDIFHNSYPCHSHPDPPFPFSTSLFGVSRGPSLIFPGPSAPPTESRVRPPYPHLPIDYGVGDWGLRFCLRTGLTFVPPLTLRDREDPRV